MPSEQCPCDEKSPADSLLDWSLSSVIENSLAPEKLGPPQEIREMETVPPPRVFLPHPSPELRGVLQQRHLLFHAPSSQEVP